MKNSVERSRRRKTESDREMRMKERSGCFSSSTRSSSSSDEDEVAGILVELQTLIDFGYPSTWGCKRKRSAIAVTSSSRSRESPPSPPLPPKGAKATSPVTPLSFPSSSDHESDHNPTTPTPTTTATNKRKRESYLKAIEELTKANNSLYGEVKNVKSYFDRLKDFNLKLKERKQELSIGPPNQDDTVHKAQQGLKFPGTGTGSGTAQHVSLNANQTTVPPQICDGEGVGGQATMSMGMAVNINSHDVGPTGIPDLNVPLEEPVDFTEGLDVNVVMANKNLNRAVAAQARKNRLQICRVKNPIPNNKNLYSFS